MEEIRKKIAQIYDALAAWMEFGILSAALLIFIPYALTIGVLLLLLPLFLIVLGLTSPWYGAIYIFVVMALVGAYCYRKYKSGGDPNSPIAGRPITTQERAVRRSRSIMRNTKGKR